MESRGTVCVIEALCHWKICSAIPPTCDLYHPVSADYSMTPSHFEQVPQNLVQGSLKHQVANLLEPNRKNERTKDTHKTQGL